MNYSKYFIGFRVYVHFLEEMIRKEKDRFVQEGYYDHKNFNSVEEPTYDGYAYRTTLGKLQCVLKNRVRGNI